MIESNIFTHLISVAKTANAPVYALYRTVLGKGAVAGVVISFEAVGQQGAKIIRGLLAGAMLMDVVPIGLYALHFARTAHS